ncbi:MAG: thermonuclease family protein [Chloroflexi bacterium]|nr:thermonuclease family protein [Chloroflexota bacterium]
MLPVPPPLTSTAAPSLAATEVPPTPAATPIPTATPRPGRDFAQVLRVWDGNTVLIEGGATIRYIGVDTPGAGMFGRSLEPFGRQAAERNVALVERKRVEIQSDVSDLDSAGFLLRYVYVDGVMVNEMLLREGLGKLAPLGSNLRYQAGLERAEAAARAAPLNIWTLVTPTATPTPTPTVAPTLAASPATPRGTVLLTRTPDATTRPLTASPTLGFALTPVRT